MATGELEGRAETPTCRGLALRELLLFGGLASIPRLLGLGHVSLWLDEILGTLQTSGTLSETWEQLKGVRVHPPLWGLLNWLTLRFTDDEFLRRLLPIAFGVGAVVVLADFTCRKFGRATAYVCAAIAALSPFHIRYSQELRAYSLGVLTFVLALWTLDRALERGRRVDWLLFSVSLWAGLSTLYLVALVVVPGCLLVVGTRKPPQERRRDLGRFALAVVVAALAFAPWYAIVGKALAKEHELAATRWSAGLALERWHFLTAAAQDGESANLGSLGLGLVALVGAAVALRSRPGRAVLAGAIVGTLGVELSLTALQHWSNGRYSIAAWPFLVVILALGCQGVGAACSWLWFAVGRSNVRLRPAVIAFLALLGVVSAEVLGTLRYYRHGRPDWLSLAREAALAVPSPGVVLAANDWTRISLGYYLSRAERSSPAAISPRVRLAGPVIAPVTGQPCSVLVAAGFPERPDLDDLFADSPAQRRYPRSEARLVAVAASAGAQDVDPWRCLPRALESALGERPPVAWGIPLQHGASAAGLEMVEADAPQLLFGWSFAERNRQGVTFRWALGHWAAVALPPAIGHLQMRAWAFEDGQRLTVYRDRRAVAELALSRQPQEIGIDWPALRPTGGGEVVYLHFDDAASAGRIDRPLAAGFDRIEIVDSGLPQPLR